MVGVDKLDLIVIGGGHNGLTTAAYAARAGKKVLVCERRHVLGGAAVTEEIAPGYRCSTLSYVASLLHPKVVKDLDLKRHGLSLVRMKSSFSPQLDGSYLLQTGDVEHDRREVAKFSSRDWGGMQALEALINEVADFLRPMLLSPPPPLIEGRLGLADMFMMGKLGMGYRRLSPAARHRMMQLFTGSISDVVTRYVKNETLQIGYYGTAVTGALSEVTRPGSALNLLHLSLGRLMGDSGSWAIVKGGMGQVSASIAACARNHGAEIRTDAGVQRIIVEDGRAVGVELESGERIGARVVASGCEPKRTFLGLLDRAHLPNDFYEDISQWKTLSGSFRLSLAVSELPDFTCLPGTKQSSHHEGFIALKPSIKAIERAYLHALAGELPEEPLLSIVIPSTLDDSLAPVGSHVICVHAQHYPFTLSGGRSWDDLRDEAADRIVATIAQYAPNLPGAIVGRHILTPLDLEREYGLTGGDIYHGKMEMDQLFAMRPHPSCSGYRTPIPGLYLCASGSHPGGGVSSVPGHNAARVILSDL